MDRFEDAGPITTFGDVVERRNIRQFFVGTTMLIGLGLVVILVLLMVGLNLQMPLGTPIAVLILSFVGGVSATILAIARSSEMVFVPYLRIAPNHGVQMFRSEDPIDGENYEYRLLVPTEEDAELIQYRGVGESAESVSVVRMQHQAREQAEFDMQFLVELDQPVYIESLPE